MPRVSVLIEQDHEDYIETHMLSKSKLVRRGLELAIAEHRQLYLVRQAPATVAAPTTTPEPTPEPADPYESVELVQGRIKVDDLCFLLDIKAEDYYAHVDREDLVTDLARATVYATDFAVREGVALAKSSGVDQTLIERFETWWEKRHA